MARILDKSNKKLDEIRDNIENANQYFKKNNDNFNRFKKFVYESSVTEQEGLLLEQVNKPTMQFNVCEAYVSRLKGEFSKQEPSISTRALNDNVNPETVNVVSGHIRHIFEEAARDKLQSRAYDDTLSGGFSVLKVYTEYENSNNFNQVIRLGKVFDPTLCFFDPLARKSYKSDGNYCGELYPITEEHFKEEYPDVNLESISFNRMPGVEVQWFYTNKNKKILLIADYYVKHTTRTRLYYLSNHQTMEKSDYDEMIKNWTVGRIEQPPSIIKKRWKEEYSIDRYKIIGNKILEATKTDYSYLPLIFVDGNSAMIKESNGAISAQLTRAYFYQAMDAQRLKNFAGQTFANEIENMIGAKFFAAESSIPENYLEFWKNPQRVSTLIFKDKDSEGNPVPEPRVIPPTPIPPEVYQAFQGSDNTIQNILGSYDASLGRTNNQLSGVAIVEGATQSNASAMPYVTNFMAAMNQVAQVILDLIPKYYITPRTIPIITNEGHREFALVNQPNENFNAPSMKFSSGDLDIKVDAAVNFKVQQHRSLETMANLSNTFEEFRAFINSKGLNAILSNVDIKGIDELKLLAKEWTQQQEQMQKMQQQGQGNQQNEASEMMQTQQQELQLKQQKQQMEYQFNLERIKNEQQKLENERLKIIIQAEEARAGAHVQYTKAQTERQVKAEELAMKQIELSAKQDQDIQDIRRYSDEQRHVQDDKER